MLEAVGNPDFTGETVQTAPKKMQTIAAAASDRSTSDGVNDFVENSISAALARDRSEATVEVIHDSETDRLYIVDNSGGIKYDNIEAVLRYGVSVLEDGGGTSTYSNGCKIGGYVLSDEGYVVYTQSTTESFVGSGQLVYDDTADEVEKATYEEWPELPIETTEVELGPGTTVVEIHDLKIDFDSLVDEVRDSVGKKFQKFIRDKYNGLSTEVFINGEAVSAPSPPEWSHTPFYLCPSEFNEFEIPVDHLPEGTDEPVTATVLVGYVRTSDGGEPGVDIYCSGMLIEDKITSEKGGFKSNGPFGEQRNPERIRVEIEFESTENRELLPWNQAKNSVNEASPVLDKLYTDWLKDVVRPYWIASKWLPDAFIEPFDMEFEGSRDKLMNLSESYRGREYLRTEDKLHWNSAPNGHLTVKDKLDTLVNIFKAHALFNVFEPSILFEDEYCPKGVSKNTLIQAYKETVLKIANDTEVGYWNVETNNRTFDTDDFMEINDEIEPLKHSKACESLHKAIRYVSKHDAVIEAVGERNIPSWLENTYEHYVSQTDPNEFANCLQITLPQDEVNQTCHKHAMFMLYNPESVDVPQDTYETILKLYADCELCLPAAVNSDINQFKSIKSDPEWATNRNELLKQQHTITEKAYSDATAEQYEPLHNDERQKLYDELVTLHSGCSIDELKESTNKTKGPKTNQPASNTINPVNSGNEKFRPKNPELKSFQEDVELMMRGWYPNQRNGDTGVGYTFEYENGITENNRKGPDLEELGIELKTVRRDSNKNITLCSADPEEELRLMWGEELIHEYGMDNTKGDLSVNSPLWFCKYNNNDLKLELSDDEENLRIIDREKTIVATYNIPKRIREMINKLNILLFVKANSIENQEGIEFFNYNQATLYENIKENDILDFIKNRTIRLEPRMKIYADGRKKDRGLRWVISEKDLEKIYENTYKFAELDEELPSPM